MVAGMYAGFEYGMEKARGKQDWVTIISDCINSNSYQCSRSELLTCYYWGNKRKFTLCIILQKVQEEISWRHRAVFSCI